MTGSLPYHENLDVKIPRGWSGKAMFLVEVSQMRPILETIFRRLAWRVEQKGTRPRLNTSGRKGKGTEGCCFRIPPPPGAGRNHGSLMHHSCSNRGANLIVSTKSGWKMMFGRCDKVLSLNVKDYEHRQIRRAGDPQRHSLNYSSSFAENLTFLSFVAHRGLIPSESTRSNVHCIANYREILRDLGANPQLTRLPVLSWA